MKYFYKYYDKATDKALSFALKKFVKSDYLKNKSVYLPLSLITIVTRSIFNFLITSRLRTGVYILDMIFSIFVTVSFSLLSPFFYHLWEKILDDEVDYFTGIMINGVWVEGWNYVEFWKTRILGSLGIFAIFILFFIEINSRMIQEFIFHIMLSSVITDLIIEYSKEKEVKVKIETNPSEVLLKRQDSYSNFKEAKKLDFELIEEYVSKDRKRNKAPEFPFLEFSSSEN